MTVPEILKELEPYTGRFPKKAMLAAVHAYSGANRTPIPIHFGHWIQSKSDSDSDLLLSLYQQATRPGQPYRQPATLRSAVFLAGAVLGWSAKHMVVRLSTAWGGLHKHKPLIQRALAWTNPTSPKLAPAPSP